MNLRLRSLSLASILLVISDLVVAAGPTHEVVASFGLPPVNPSRGGLVLDSQGYFWGATYGGGRHGSGTLYKIKADGSDWRTVISFTGDGGRNKGDSPHGGLVSDGRGFLWGTTHNGGDLPYPLGTIFKVNIRTGAFTTVYQMVRERDLFYFNAGLVNDGAGFLWGTTDSGFVFKVNSATGAVTKEAAFPYSDSYSDRSALASDGAGFFWGTTAGGYSGPNDFGTIYKVNATNRTIKTVVRFTGREDTLVFGRSVSELVLDAAGFFWGTTQLGGQKNLGTVFKIDTRTNALTTVVQFTGNGAHNKGAYPLAKLFNDQAGFFWGTTAGGGAKSLGTAFKINAMTGELTTVAEFGGRLTFPNTGLVSDHAGSLWGTTSGGGAVGLGTVFKVNVQTGLLIKVLDFGANVRNQGKYPEGDLFTDGSSFFWGSTFSGGSRDRGMVFKVDSITGALTRVVERGSEGAGIFELHGDGTNPFEVAGHELQGLVSDGAGFLWGVDTIHGTLFKVNAINRTRSTVVTFVNADSMRPNTDLVDDGAGFLWGTSSRGGEMYQGTIFKVNTRTGEFTTVVNFTEDGLINKGSSPYGGLVNDGTGFFWGTTYSGGTNRTGTVFKVNTSSGELTTLVEFTGNGTINKGRYPAGGLVNDGAGSFWGTTFHGGTMPEQSSK